MCRELWAGRSLSRMFARKAGLIIRSGSELETRHLSVLVPMDKNVHAYPSALGKTQRQKENQQQRKWVRDRSRAES